MQSKDQLEFNGTILSKPITTKVDKTKANVAVMFNKGLHDLSRVEYQMSE